MSHDLVTVNEAAQILGTSKEKIARLVRQGILTARPSVLDARRRLIPRAEIDRLLEAEGRHVPVEDEKETGNTRRPRPRTAAMYTGPIDVHSDEVEGYLSGLLMPLSLCVLSGMVVGCFHLIDGISK